METTTWHSASIFVPLVHAQHAVVSAGIHWQILHTTVASSTTWAQDPNQTNLVVVENAHHLVLLSYPAGMTYNCSLIVEYLYNVQLDCIKLCIYKYIRRTVVLQSPTGT